MEDISRYFQFECVARREVNDTARRVVRSSAKSRYWITYIPGVVVLLLSVLIGGILGGPIVVAIIAFAAVPSLALCCVLCFFVLLKYKPTRKIHSLLLGLGLCVVSVGVVLLLLIEFSPSQIM